MNASPSKEPRRATVEAAGVADAPMLAALHARALPPGWPEQSFEHDCADPNRAVLKAIAGSQLCGLATLQVAANEAEILTVAVDEDARRQGVGALLLSHAIGLARMRGAERLYLEVAEGNTPALALYRRAGFAVIARREHYYQSGRTEPEAALIMSRDFAGEREPG